MNLYKSKQWKRKRQTVLRRDEYRCRECRRYGKTTDGTTVHHVNQLKDRPELCLTTANLISLCNKCHEMMHDRLTDTLTDLGKQWVERVSPYLKDN